MIDIVDEVIEATKFSDEADRKATLANIRAKTTAKMRQLIRSAKDFPRKPDWNITRPGLKHGWALPLLHDIEFMTNGRWDWWAWVKGHWVCYKTLPDELIPEIDWLCNPEPRTRKMLEACLETISYNGSHDSLRYLIDWVLYSFGSHFVQELPREPCKGASDRLYQIFCIDALLTFPYDYWGDLLAEAQVGKDQGFFPTPMSVCLMMARMTMGEKTLEMRIQGFMEPCMGTGRMLMVAGDYSLCLFGQDINETVIKAAMINFYLYVPWAVSPINFPEPPKPQTDFWNYWSR